MLSDPQWYKDAVIYQIHVKAFFDSNDDGIGDIQGLIQKLGYLRDLGVDTLWLLPFYPSPLRDDGYDIADYYNVHPDYGTLRDFRMFLKKAHSMGFKVITELVINHTSDQHPWFQRARRARPGSSWHDFYVWSDDPGKYSEARVIFQDFETSNWAYDPVAKSYFWHRFYSHQPDLNFDNPRVRREMFKVLDHWLDMGVDGFRLDAIPYLFEREGTNCENLPETHQFLRELRGHIEDKYGSRMLLAEANQWPEDAVNYFGYSDECHMAFHFPIMPRIFMSLWMEDRFPIVDIMEQTPPIPDTCQWVMFLRNHDELTLEMVTDEERDYMYRVYARDQRARINLGIRRRLFPLLQQNRRKAELLNFILFSLPGTPCLYYGDEIGMGDNYYLGDRNGVRTPMQWSPDRNGGFSKADPQKLYLPVIMNPEYHYEALNVENHERNPSSFLWWVRRVISMRKQIRALSRGSMNFIACSNPRILVFTRELDGESLLVVANMSRFPQVAELDLSEYEGFIPEEVFGGSAFPKISSAPYILTMGIHDHFWFRLKDGRRPAGEGTSAQDKLPFMEIPSWHEIGQGPAARRLAGNVLPAYLQRCRWFGGKARPIRKMEVTDTVHVMEAAGIILVRVLYTEGQPETYSVPVSFAAGLDEARIREQFPSSVIAEASLAGAEGILYDCACDTAFQARLLEILLKKKRTRGASGVLYALQGRRLKHLDIPRGTISRILSAEQSNTSVQFGDILFLKLLRKVEEGPNPDREISQFLTEQTRFLNTPPFAGAIEYVRPSEPPVLLGVFQEFIPNQGSAWSFVESSLDKFFETLLTVTEGPPPASRLVFTSTLEDGGTSIFPGSAGEFFFGMMRLLGQRTAEMHLALTSRPELEGFEPEPFSKLYQRAVFQSMRSLASGSLKTLDRMMETLPDDLRESAGILLSRKKDALGVMSLITTEKIMTQKIRIHGDYHLGQVLFTGKDFIIIDFEGEPMRPLSERRLKRSPFRDLAGMLRSFDYAISAAIKTSLAVRPQDEQRLLPWRQPWLYAASTSFLAGYAERAKDAGFIPGDDSSSTTLLNAFIFEKAFYELNYELNNRPGWVDIPVRSLVEMIDTLTEGPNTPGGERA